MTIKFVPATITPQAAALNNVIASSNPEIMSLFSPSGKRAHLDKNGIIKQSGEAAQKATEANMTIGVALDDDGKPLVFDAAKELFAKMDISLTAGIMYGKSDGLPALRERLRDQLGIEGAGLPVITSGLTNSISNVAQLFCSEGSTVVMHNFAWENIPRIYNDMFGCTFATYPFYNKKNTGFNLEGLGQATEIAHKKLHQNNLLVYLNHPNNPTGYNLTDREGHELRSTLTGVLDSNKDMNIVVLTDEAYFGYSYAGATDKPIMSYLVNAHPRLLAIGAKGPTKEVNVWGLRVGALYALPYGMNPDVIAALSEKFAGVSRAILSMPSALGQEITKQIYLSHAFLDNKTMIKEVLQRRGDLMKSILMTPEYQKVMPVYPFNAGYFCSCHVPNAEAVRQDLLARKVGVIANDSTLSGEESIRLAFSSIAEAKIPRALESVRASVIRCGL